MIGAAPSTGKPRGPIQPLAPRARPDEAAPGWIRGNRSGVDGDTGSDREPRNPLRPAPRRPKRFRSPLLGRRGPIRRSCLRGLSFREAIPSWNGAPARRSNTVENGSPRLIPRQEDIHPAIAVMRSTLCGNAIPTPAAMSRPQMANRAPTAARLHRSREWCKAGTNGDENNRIARESAFCPKRTRKSVPLWDRQTHNADPRKCRPDRSADGSKRAPASISFSVKSLRDSHPFRARSGALIRDPGRNSTTRSVRGPRCAR